MLAVFVWFLLCMPRFVFIYYVLLVYICHFYAIRPLFWSLNIMFSSFYTFSPLKHDLFCTRISSLYIMHFFIFIITSCNYLFIISTCHVISSVIFWRHSQQVAYHVIYKVLVTWHMIFKRNTSCVPFKSRFFELNVLKIFIFHEFIYRLK